MVKKIWEWWRQALDIIIIITLQRHFFLILSINVLRELSGNYSYPGNVFFQAKAIFPSSRGRAWNDYLIKIVDKWRRKQFRWTEDGERTSKDKSIAFFPLIRECREIFTRLSYARIN